VYMNVGLVRVGVGAARRVRLALVSLGRVLLSFRSGASCSRFAFHQSALLLGWDRHRPSGTKV